MEIKTLSGTRTINFPQSPPDGWQHAEHGRVWEWMADPGIWRSVSSGVPENGGNAGPITWDEILAKPEGIEALGNSGIIIGGTYSGN